MKKLAFSMAVVIGLTGLLASCGKSESKPAAPKKSATPIAVENGVLPSYRFIDFDSITLQYALSKELTEQTMRLQNNLEAEQRKQYTSLQSRANALQKKMDNVTSQTEADALRSEYEGLQSQQSQAEQKLAQMGSELEKTMAANAKTVMDSLSNFLSDFAAERGYSAIFMKEFTPYYNPALDVTGEVIEGLNARYNKVK